MASIVSSLQSNALEQSVLAQLEVSEFTLLALQRARELERELILLRGALLDPSVQEHSALTKQEQVANLLSRVVLFRLAMSEPPRFDDKVAISGRASHQL